MTDTFKDHVVLVTGAGKGIGRATASAFIRAGAIVYLADQDDDALGEAAAALTAGDRARTATLDVTDDAAVFALVDRIVGEAGRIDVAVNNAGIITPNVPTADFDIDDWDRIVAVNLRGTFRCMQAELKHMVPQGAGAIVNVSSIGGLVGVAGLPAYCASKHGILGLTKSAALDYCGRGIRINAVCPGQIDTPMNTGLTGGDEEKVRQMLEATQPIGRLGTADEIAAAILWLAGPAASFMIGAAVPVDGGQAAR